VKNETNLQRQIILEATRLNIRLFRNNIVNGWTGESSMSPNGTVLIRSPRRIACGIPGPGGSDLLGWRTLANGTAQFVSIEIKTATGRASQAQLDWLDCVTLAGGLAGIVRSVDDLHALLRK